MRVSSQLIEIAMPRKTKTNTRRDAVLNDIHIIGHAGDEVPSPLMREKAERKIVHMTKQCVPHIPHHSLFHEGKCICLNEAEEVFQEKSDQYDQTDSKKRIELIP